MGIMNIIIIVVIVLFFISIFGLFILKPELERQQLKQFCEDNGFNGYYQAWRSWETSYCSKQEGNTLIKKEVDWCVDDLNKWCFVENVK